MLNLNVNLTSLAVILWSGMLIISGSIWVLASQVRKLADLLEARESGADVAAPAVGPMPTLRVYDASGRARSVRRVASAPARRVAR